jgi:hypothetical protein
LAEQEEVAGISLGLSLDTAGFSAGIARAKSELAGLEAAPVKIRTEVVTAREAIKVPVTPVFGVGREELALFRTQIEDGFKKTTGGGVQLGVSLARINFGALRSEIAAGIGTVPIKISVSGGGKGSALDLVAATVAEQGGSETQSATAFVKNAAAKRGIPTRQYGGPVGPRRTVMVGEAGPELAEFGGPVYIRPNHSAQMRGFAPGGRIPNEDLRRVARQYTRSIGRPDPIEGVYHPLDPDFSRRTARAYEAMPTQANAASTRSYRAFVDETMAQWRTLRGAGYGMTPSKIDPYQPAGGKTKMQLAAEDVRRNKNLNVFASYLEHPMMSNREQLIFRHVHDLFGHLAEGNSIGPRGEYNAAIQHSQMYSPLARRAMLAETHGQNSVVNFSDTVLPGRTRSIAAINAEAPGSIYAEQKARNLPEKILREFYARAGIKREAGGPAGFFDIPAVSVEAERKKKERSLANEGMTMADFMANASPADKDFVNNLERAHTRLQPHHVAGGEAWYHDAGAFGRALARKYGVDERTGVGVLAALSAGTEWEANKTKAEKILSAHASGKPFPYSMNFDAHKKAAAILGGEDPAVSFASSPKVGQFFDGLMGNLQTLTIDRWALRTATRGKLSQIGEGPVRTQIEQAWRQIADKYQMAPAVSQAALWLLEKEENTYRTTQAPGQAMAFASGGFAHASEASALNRLREITSPSGAILPGYLGEAQAINLQIEQMRRDRVSGPSSPWLQRMRANQGLAKEFRGPGGRVSYRDKFATSRNRAAEGRSYRAWARQANQPRDALGRYMSPYDQGAWYDREGYNDPDFISLTRTEPAMHPRMRSDEEYHWLHAATGGRANRGRYIVGERGKELFVPKRMESLIPRDVMQRLPKREQGGIVEIGQKPFSEWSPPEDGWVIPNHLRHRIPGMAPGGRVSPGQMGLGLDEIPLSGAGWEGITARVRELMPQRRDQTANAPVNVNVVGIDTRAAAAIAAPQGAQAPQQPMFAGGPETRPQGRYQFHRPEDVDPADVQSPRERAAAEREAERADRVAARPDVQGIAPWQPTTTLHARSNALRRAPGRAGLISGRSSVRSAFANIGSFFLGGREASEQARMQETIERQTLRQYETRGGQLQRQQVRSTSRLQDLRDREELNPPQSARGREALSRQITLATRAQERDTQALAEHETATQKQTKIVEEAARRAQPGGKNVAQNIFGIAAGVGSYQIAQKGLDLAIGAALPAAEKWVDMWTGFRSTATRVTTDLASQTEALHGNADAAIAAASATANLSKSSLDYVSANLKTTVSVKAGAQAQEQASELFRAAYGASQGRAPEGLFSGYGGLFGSSLGAGQMGGGKGFTESVYGDLTGVQSQNKPPDLVGDLSAGLSFMADEGTRNAVLGAAKQQGNPIGTIFDAIGGLGDALHLGGGAAAPLQQATGGPAAYTAQPAGLTLEQAKASNAIMGQLTDAAARGVGAVKDGLKGVTFSYAETADELNAAKMAAAGAGDLQGFAGIEHTHVIARVNGQAVTDSKQYQQVMQQTAVGQGIPDLATLAPGYVQGLRASQAMNAARAAFQTNVNIPAQLGMQLAANPLQNVRAGVMPSAGATSFGSPLTAGLSAGASAEVEKHLARAEAIQKDLNAQAADGLKIAHDTVEANHGNVVEYDKAMASVTAYGKEIAGLQESIDFTQSTLSAKQFNNQMYYLNRNLSDAKGLAGQVSGGDNLGALQRQSFMIGRQQQSIGFGLQQRQITTQVALAGFQAPGESPEERYARREEARITARTQQRQLNLSRQQFGVQGQIFNVSAARGVTDAGRAIVIANAEHEAAVAIAAKGKEIAAAQQAQAVAQAKAQAQYEAATNNFSDRLAAAGDMMAKVPGATLAQAFGALDTVMNGPSGPGAIFSKWLQSTGITSASQGTGGDDTAGGGGSGGRSFGGSWADAQPNLTDNERERTTNPYQNTNAGPGRGSRVPGTGTPPGNARGIVGMTAGPTHMYIGEAGRETVAILRNPRAAQLGGGGVSGGNITIMVTGNSFGAPGDDQKLVQKIEAAVMSAMARKGQLLGLRGPSN